MYKVLSSLGLPILALMTLLLRQRYRRSHESDLETMQHEVEAA